jgi:hypothetical protein
MIGVTDADDIVGFLGFAKDALVDTAALGGACKGLIAFIRHPKGRKTKKLR